MLAVPGETVAGLPDPWPLKIIIDNLLQGKRPPDWLAGIEGEGPGGLVGGTALAVESLKGGRVTSVQPDRRHPGRSCGVPWHKR